MKRAMYLVGILFVSGVVMAGTPPKASAPAAPKVTPELIAKGKTAYVNTCLVCHGEKGDGMGPAGSVLNPKPRDLRVVDPKVGGHYKMGGKPEHMFKAITEGLPGTAMAPFGSLPEADRWAIVYYIQSELQKKK